ncbi:MAG TPA: outer membrane beta-barrel protein [Vicinamibacterales bacterium]|jgi:opacity protein-like surface antigen
MRSFVVVLLGSLTLTSVASAQSIGADKGYIEGVAQSAISNVTSQSFGVEGGFTVMPRLQIYAEAGQVSNVATAQISSAAQQIAGVISQTQSNVGYSVKQPVTFFVAGGKFLVPMDGKLQPYVMGGFGVAKVKQDATFSVNGTDVTSSLAQPQYGSVQLGSDLSGTFTKPMLSIGGGVMWAAWQRLVVDVQYRYGRVFAPDQGININRIGVGIGVRF